MIEVLKDKYWSKSEAFILPLTGLNKSQKYEMKSYLFWEEYSIENYILILEYKYKDEEKEEFSKYCRRNIFPQLDKDGYLIESHDFTNSTILILDLSEWALDIEMFLKGKYSKMSRDAKDFITSFHTFYDRGPKIMIEISAALDPYGKFSILGNISAIEYVAENYGLNILELKKIGELCSIYNEEKETLVLNENYFKQEGNTLV